jgi:hypothetical protein
MDIIDEVQRELECCCAVKERRKSQVLGLPVDSRVADQAQPPLYLYEYIFHHTSRLPCQAPQGCCHRRLRAKGPRQGSASYSTFFPN